MELIEVSGKWYLSRDGEQHGPYDWKEVTHYVSTGNIEYSDMLWNESTGQWLQAGQIPGLFPGPMPVKKAGGKKTALIAFSFVLALLLVGAGLFAFFGDDFFGGDDGSAESPELPGLGEYRTKDPDEAFLVDTEEWGTLPANQIAIILEDGLGDEEAQEIAASLGANIVGEIELINFYQLETNSRSAAELYSDLSRAENFPGVETAMPNIPVFSRLEIEGRSCSPLNDPMYGGNGGRAYDMIGLQEAWDIIRATGVELNTTRVGVIDSSIYNQSGHQFSPELHLPDNDGRHPPGRVRTTPINSNRDLTSSLHTDSDGELELGGLGHGTAVTHVIGADPNGGTAGVAGILGENLEILVSTQGSGRYFSGTENPDNPVQWGNWTYRSLERMLEQVENGATVINLSWGPAQLGPQNQGGSDMMRKFLRIMNERHPDVVFVGAAGNSGQGIDGHNDYWGKDLPNLITVGALNHDGERAEVRDWYDQETLEQAYQQHLQAGSIDADTTFDQFVDSLQSGSNYAVPGGEVTLSASGTGVPIGVDPDGRTVTANGTSFSAPQVVAAAALIRSINPELNAADIKRILTESASREVDRDGNITEVPTSMGAGVLRVDNAVLQTINEMRAGPRDAPDYPKLPPLTREDLLGMSRVTLKAELIDENPSGGGKEWLVTASIGAVSPGGGTELELRTSGQGFFSGNTKQSIAAAGGEVSWRITALDENYVVRVFRSDTGGCAMLELFLVDLTGSWVGTWVLTDSLFFHMDPEEFMAQAEANVEGDIGLEGCEEAMASLGPAIILSIIEFFKSIQGVEVPLSMELTQQGLSGIYNGWLLIHLDQVVDDGSIEAAEKQYFTAVLEGSTLKIVIAEDDFITYFNGNVVSPDYLTGTFSTPVEIGNLMSGTWSAYRLGDE